MERRHSFKGKALEGNEGATSTNVEESMARSLGRGGSFCSGVRSHRRSSEVASITYSGYLLKRSNHPFMFANSEVPVKGEEAIKMCEGLGFRDVGESYEMDIEKENRSSSSMAQHDLLKGEENECKDDQSEDGLEIATFMAAAFFGLGTTEVMDKNQKEESSDSLQAECLVSVVKHEETSTPVPIAQGAESTANTEETVKRENRNYHKSISSPARMDSDVPGGTNIVGDDSLSDPPVDFVDETDGHIWRAKYCVLENNVLFFYRHASDAFLPQARAERLDDPGVFHHPSISISPVSSQPQLDFLSKSPMTRNIPLHLDHNMNHNDSFTHRDNCIWEKRVALEAVGAVRSAEDDYGECSFVLLTADDSHLGGTDCLILRAASTQQMQEWLFQFHSSLAFFMRQIVKSIPTNRLLVPPSSAQQTPTPPQPMINTYHVSGLYLSHGHGRASDHRKKFRAKTASMASSTAGDISPAFSSTSLDKMPTVPPETITVQSEIPFSSDIVQTSATQELLKSRPESSSLPAKPVVKKYVPPHRRKKPPSMPPPTPITDEEENGDYGMFDMTEEETLTAETEQPIPVTEHVPSITTTHHKLGGCADPDIVGSVLDPCHRKYKVAKVKLEPYGTYGGGLHIDSSLDEEKETKSEVDISSFQRPDVMQWEVGAVSECGVRDSNEDAYLIAKDLLTMFPTLSTDTDAPDSSVDAIAANNKSSHGLFAIFDGHCGSQAARYAAEKLPSYLHDSISNPDQTQPKPLSYEHHLEQALHTAIYRLDEHFCQLCKEDGRDWDCGSTALITIVHDNTVIIANLGDCRGVICGSTFLPRRKHPHGKHPFHSWNLLESDQNKKKDARYYWKEVTRTHSPSREDEKQRIEAANGWITVEQEVCLAGQLHRMDFCDDDVVEILKRCFSSRFLKQEDDEDDDDGEEEQESDTGEGSSDDPQEKDNKDSSSSAAAPRLLKISRVCGELSVSRALGDRDFKASFNDPPVHSHDNTRDW